MRQRVRSLFLYTVSMSKQDILPAGTYPVDFLQMAAAMAERRGAEKGGGDIAERTKKVREIIQDPNMLQKWLKDNVPCSMYLDTKGLKIDLGAEGNKQGIHTHIPFGELEIEDISRIQSLASLMPEEDVLELQRQKYKAASEREHVDAITRKQIEALVGYFENNVHPESSFRKGRTSEELESALVGYFVRNPKLIADAVRYGDLHIPEDVIRKMATEPMKRDHALALFKIAEQLNRNVHEVDYLDQAGERQAHFMRVSHDPTRVTSRVFDARRLHLRRDQNYEVAKIINTLFETVSISQIEAAGVRLTRGKFREDTQFVALWDEDDFHRVYLDPDIHFSPRTYERVMGKKMRFEEPSEENAISDVLERPEFEFFEGLLLPYRAFKGLVRSLTYSLPSVVAHSQLYSDQGTMDKIASSLRGVMTVAETECDVEEFSAIYEQVRIVRKAIRLRSLSAPQVATFMSVLNRIKNRYESSMQGKSAREVIALRKGVAVPSDHSFDDSYRAFVAKLPDSLKKKFENRPESSCKTKIVSIDEKGLSFAQEPEVLRALKLKPGPVIMAIGGASKMKTDEGTVSQVAQFADILHEASLEVGAHILGPETDVGLGAELGRVNRAYFERTTEEERKKHPKIFGVGPGKDLGFANNPNLDKTDTSAAWPATTMDIIATPFHAGWSQHDSRSEQIRHNYYRQALTRRIAGEYIKKDDGGTINTYARLAVVGNGGAWAALEVLAALEDDTPILCIRETGRLASFLSLVKDRTSEWSELAHDDDDLSQYLRALIVQIEPTEVREEIARDFENATYHSALLEILQLGKLDLIHTTDTLAGMKSSILQIMRP